MSLLMRMISHREPPNYHSDPNDIDLTRSQLATLLEYQLGLPAPRYLTPGSFFVAGLTDSQTTSTKIHAALQKAAILPAAPRTGPSSASASAAAPVTTAAIGKHFRRQLPFISEYARRKLVGLLFFWEQQCVRWTVLDEEEAGLLGTMGREGMDMQELEQALSVVRAKRRLLPNQEQV